MDAYKQSQYHPEILVDLETRMSWVYRRTGTAMAITSATTCAAFLCTLITPLASLQSFGIFAAVVSAYYSFASSSPYIVHYQPNLIHYVHITGHFH